MKTLVQWLFILLISSVGASAQVTLELLTDQTEYLCSESIPVQARFVNNSGQTLHLGADEDWLSFSVDGQIGTVVNKTGEVPVARAFELESSKMATKTVDLAPYFDLTKPGRYTITATAAVPEWNVRVKSPPKSFNVVPGLRVWEKLFGVPPVPGAEPGQPEVRKYALLKVNYRDSMKLYLRLTDDSESRVFKVYPIGSMVSFSRVEPQLDKLSNLHVIYQTSSRTFLYTMINPQGQVILRQTHDYTTTRPRLGFDESGKVVVVGGVRHLAENDIPPSDPLLSAGEAKPATKP